MKYNLDGGMVMDNGSQQGGEPSAVRATQPSQRNNYGFLLRMSRGLGNVATRSSFMQDVKSFMNHEISYSTPSRWLETSIAMIRGGNQEVSGRPRQPEPVPATQPTKEEELRNIVTRSHELLMSVNTVFPITLFPDTVSVDRTKVTITRRDFFWTSEAISFRVEDILNVTATVGPLFGSLTVASRVMSTVDHFQIKHLWRTDAIRLKHIIQGYVIAQHNNIDTAHLDRKTLIETVVELGHDSSM